MTIEILDYDVIGNAELMLQFRRRAEFIGDPALPVPVDANGVPTVAVDEKGLATRMVSPTGPILTLKLSRAELPAADWARLQAKFDAFTEEARLVAEDRYAGLLAAPSVLDDKIALAEKAKHDAADIEAQMVEARAALAKVRAELAAAAGETGVTP